MGIHLAYFVMKRTRKTTSAKPRKKSVSSLQKKLWGLCKEIIRKEHGNTCYTCGAGGLEGANWHTGHMWAKASLGAHLKYDLRVLRPQCYRCNINFGGQGAVFYKNMVQEFGQEYMDNLEKEKQILVKADSFFYEAKIHEYQEKLRALS